MRFAAGEGRVFITRDRGDFILPTVEFFRAGDPHPGVLVVGRNVPNDRAEGTANTLERWAETRAAAPESLSAFGFL